MAEKQPFWLWATKPFRRGEKPEPTPVGASPRGSLLVRLEELGVDFGNLSLVLASAPLLNAVSPILLDSDLIGATDDTLFTAGKDYRDVSIYLVNVTTASRTVQISVGALTDVNSRCKNRSIEVGGRDLIHLPSLANGAAIHGVCDQADGVVAEIYGVPMS